MHKDRGLRLNLGILWLRNWFGGTTTYRQDPSFITLEDLVNCRVGHTVVSMLIDVNGFYEYDNREALLQAEDSGQEAEALMAEMGGIVAATDDSTGDHDDILRVHHQGGEHDHLDGRTATGQPLLPTALPVTAEVVCRVSTISAELSEVD